MNQNLAQETELREDGLTYLNYDWYPKAIPSNLVAGDQVYLDTSYSFACFHSEEKDGFQIGFASGNYLHSQFLAGKKGKIKIGKYSILESTSFLANSEITVGDHCMFSWGSYVTDTWISEQLKNSASRKEILKKIALSEKRIFDLNHSKPVLIEDNVWVGFGAVIMPGVTLGRGCVVGCKAIIHENVPPYAVVVGDPATIVMYLEPDDTPETRAQAINEFSRKS